MRLPIIPIILLLFLACNKSRETASNIPIPPPEKTLTFAFYNVENLWDPADNPTNPGDDEFTPNGPMKWTPERYEKKLAALARGIRGMADGAGPDLLGMCELENRMVLDRLVGEFLPAGAYNVAHAESPDVRGIDVALIYRPSMMELKGFRMHRIDLGPGSRPTRDIMEATFTKDGRIFTVLVNHWPSRSGGEAQTEPLRRQAAATAARIIDSLLALDPNADIILMGDLNDEPENASVLDVLDAREYGGQGEFRHRLINTAAPVAQADEIGSYYYKRDWETIDQIMLSAGSLDGRGITLYETAENVFAPEFLRDSKADADARPPHRTYIRGTLYIGGTSDHFPVYLRTGWSP